ncbi:hypothetical protein L7F22_049092 [Adiantum nelumboides]|nr:hypothetical protein [Adiantum nelumboides]
MAAALCKRNVAAGAIATMAVVLALMRMADSQDCPANLVYPLPSTCFHPAKYYGLEVYELSDVGGLGNLAPEWDESNSTYYVRLADDGGKYHFAHWTRQYRFTVSQSDNLLIKNAETYRFLGWRKEGNDYFLVEQQGEPGAIEFQFSQVENVTLTCQKVTDARCEAYYILDFKDAFTGVTAYVEDEVTYFKRSNTYGATPFVLLRCDIINTSPSLQATEMPIINPTRRHS